MAKGNGIGNFGGGSLSHLEAVAAPSVAGRVPSKCRAALGRQMRPEEARAELGYCLEVYWKGTLALCWQTLT